MSHFTTITTQIKDLAALKAASAELGLELLASTTARGYSTNVLHGDYVLRLKGPYDIAVNQQPDGTYGLTTDWWNGHVEKEVGASYGRLLQLYAVHKATLEARKRGHFVTRKAQKDGAIKLVIGGV
jgi:hypothetical protein